MKREHTYWGRRHPKHWLLAHNPVQPVHVAQPHGANGFRVMWIPPERTALKERPWRVCKCGWRPDLGTHYSAARTRKIPAPPEQAQPDYKIWVLM
jgi:hypothetical protein